MVDYVVYYRVSTERQGRSGLGLDAQRSMVERFLGPNDTLLAEFTEIQSGKRDDRQQLWKAINLVKKTKSKLLLPKLDRFSRKVSFISGIIDQGVELEVCEHPGVSTFFLHLLACFAEEERRQISERTRAALAEAKRRGVKLGQNGKRLAEQRAKDRLQFARQIKPHLDAAWADTASASEVARYFNQIGLPTANGGRWHAQTVLNYTRALSDS
ncbi:recombinase family protein [Ponticoccus sp. SC2-23]|uniref:recombinase family protein n=1 Tax=Alexandriicola marinus TaxID=2081710 RepID=UPI000FDA68E5|nr:recombinase family protein [Alexandriicola marinus]MBM1222532.1 recombinase family protein [Ponticoccus sp. SC6-9]MBM1227038.1 recombinase family protein [Ponticoccus sp. SC6-15]MBM1231459.1 recombinase family protein [Ponticoccus sp. SC6-38]MBM1236105.1 recombinase family protein [Ponticoccus sp. SC6-45]MBM1240482.1 recombinase family protein [Ponticoccus sp. SC6-49]MBM1245017.1 recombinase family protein [Ponticoccus sp. SC2-64]MBM1249580.1 recombinase family protein [Ponticoccus sp. SC